MRVDCFNVEENWLHFAPCVHGEGPLKTDEKVNAECLFHSVTPTVRYGGEFEHRVQGAPQVWQLICERRWENKDKLRLAALSRQLVEED